MEKKELSWKIEDIGRLLKNSFQAIIRGHFLLRLEAGKFFIHILYTFFLFAMVIWLSLMIDDTLNRVERNNALIKELKIEEAQKEYDLMTLERRSRVEYLLRTMGSEVQAPGKPAVRIEK